MNVEQIYTGCLAEAAYYIESDGEAAIIDPLRETKPYIERAAADGATIKYIFETHFHADFVSGHLDLSAKTDATIVFGPTAQPGYTAHVAKDGEEFSIGNVKIRVLHTPGHTMESSTFLLIDENGKETAIFTGDTLFIGDVGRPDLAVKSNLTREDLAGYLYDSLHTKILTLPDDVIVYPGHGAGSACGKNMSKETIDTLGNQKRFNYALRARSKEEFVKEVTTGLMPPPQYFPKNAVLNKMGYGQVDEVLQQGTQALSPAAFETAANEVGALMIDVRAAQEFAKGFIPNSINIGLEGQFAGWVGTLVPDLKQPILLIAPEGKAEEAVLRLARVGYDNCIGYLQGGFAAWQEEGRAVDTITSISADTFAECYEQNPDVPILDVRRKSEFESEHIVGAENLPLDYLNDNMARIDRRKTYYVHCAGGYRSMVAISILKARGFTNLVDVAGGFGAIKKTGKLPLTDYVCPTTLL
ncbi:MULTISPECIES: MBL fold metallo-hydrolase [unclassified Spirosoma]|uniref:MBL fold metallo-hydrolase n=1 Tax=unclassified Spirosoma TaxID=2621999 RepID=UPI00095BDC98|nr:MULTISPECIES: MBL fold metallo-hydrolase [unclassified Spirosoma]MBN8824194.1 MBL fold metallo-hydrolase [Spirosoma sp.]OJW78930.1 MAG: MBL fold metallo-hydrolase [Spirosoma sp. 48-14]